MDFRLDESVAVDVQIGRYTTISRGVIFATRSHMDYVSPCQGIIPGCNFEEMTSSEKSSQIIVMNDCFIGENVTIMPGVKVGNGAFVYAGSVVTEDVPPYAVVAGNPARIIDYRFNESQRESLFLIRWWNWEEEKLSTFSKELYGDIDVFIANHIEEARNELSSIIPANVQYIEKHHQGEEKILLYIPDFEQECPTYPTVIDSFSKTYAGTNTELLLYVPEDDNLEIKLDMLNQVFAKYENVDCYVNLYVDSLEDERGLFGQVDAYITNKNADNIYHIDIADLFGIPVIIGGAGNMFGKVDSASLFKDKSKTTDEVARQLATGNKELITRLAGGLKSQNESVEETREWLNKLTTHVSQISVNQYAMNQSIDNLKYEMFYDTERPVYPIVEKGEKAIELIINEGKSMSRFGDGEFAVIAGDNRQKFQLANPKLGERLKEVLASTDDNILICIANNYGDLSEYNADGKYNIRAYMTPEVRAQHYKLLDMNRVYYDAYLTRPYASYKDNNTDAPRKRFDNLRRIWKGKNLVIIEGERTRMGVGNDLFDNAKSITRILGPAVNAFDRYEDILGEALKQDKDKLILIAMGATATVLAYDLAKAGYQALDIGHIDMEYEWMLTGKGKKTEVKHKYNNEVAGGDNVEELSDPIYESQIIARCY